MVQLSLTVNVHPWFVGVSGIHYMTYLEGTIHHTNDVVKLLVIHYDTVLLNMNAQFLSEALVSCFAFQGSQCSWQSLSRQ